MVLPLDDTLVHSERCVVVDGDLVFLRLLGRNEDDAEGAASSVDRCGCGILEDGDGLYILRIDLGKGAFYTVDKDEGAGTGSDGTVCTGGAACRGTGSE